MDIHIGKIDTTVHAVDGAAVLAPEVMNRIVRTVLAAVAERQAHGDRVQQERQLGVDTHDRWEGRA